MVRNGGRLFPLLPRPAGCFTGLESALCSFEDTIALLIWVFSLLLGEPFRRHACVIRTKRSIQRIVQGDPRWRRRHWLHISTFFPAWGIVFAVDG